MSYEIIGKKVISAYPNRFNKIKEHRIITYTTLHEAQIEFAIFPLCPTNISRLTSTILSLIGVIGLKLTVKMLGSPSHYFWSMCYKNISALIQVNRVDVSSLQSRGLRVFMKTITYYPLPYSWG